MMMVLSAACMMALAAPARQIEVVGDWQLRVNHGTFRVGRKTVRVLSDTVLTVHPAERIVVRDERHASLPVFNASSAGWGKGDRFGAVVTVETTAPGLLDPATVRVKSGPGDAASYARGTDYDLDDEWGTFGRLNGKIAEGTPVWCDYEASAYRIDTIVVDRAGKVSLITGISHNATPKPPVPAPGQTAIARVWLPGRISRLADRLIYPIVEPTFPRAATKTPDAARLLPKTWAKLNAGKPVHVLAWGDSVTAGGQASSAETQYQSRFVKLLRQRFPASDIQLTTSAWGGRNSDSFLNDPPEGEHNFEKVVMQKHPDLIVMEFVNDAYLDPVGVETKYSALLERFRAAGYEWVILTPHLVWHSWLGLPDDRVESDPRPYVAGVRAFAAKHGVALADASARWCHLVKEGIPYQSMLANSLNHPDDRGHEIFALALMDVFGGVKQR